MSSRKRLETVEEFLDIDSAFVQIVRLALSGRRQDVEKLAYRVLRRAQLRDPLVLEQLRQILREAPTHSTPFRSETMSAIPVDLDSRMQLLRAEHPPLIEGEPIWPPHVEDVLKQVIEERKQLKALREAGLRPTRTALFYGPPGVGKTLAARCLARDLGIPLLTLDLASVMSSFLGRTGANIRNVLDYAKGLRCVLLIDELDAVGKRRDDPVELGELKRLVTVLLQEIDEWPEDGLLIAATNHPDLLDRAIWRRFDLLAEFPMPSLNEVRGVVRAGLGDYLGDDALLDVVAAVMSDLSFSDIQREIHRIRRQSFLRQQPLLDLIQPFIREKLRARDSRERRNIATQLSAFGLSQRRIHDLTGISRDTLRKTKAESINTKGSAGG